MVVTAFRKAPTQSMLGSLSLLASSPGRLSSALMSATATNPLTDQAGLPRFDKIQAADVKPAMSEILSRLEANFGALEATLERSLNQAEPKALSYSNVIEALEKIEAPTEYAWGVVEHLMGVSNSDELRSSHGEMQPEVIRVTTKLSQSSVIYKAIEAVAASDAPLDDVQRRILTKSLRSMRLSGVALEGEKKARFNANRMQLGELSTKFSNQVLDSTKEWSLTLMDPSDVKGLPPSARALAAQRASAAGAEASPDFGPWQLGLDMPSYMPAMKNIESGVVREKLYKAFVNRAAEENAPLIRSILSLRKEQATILGFDSHAEVSLQQKMAKTVSQVDALFQMLAEKAVPAAELELAVLTSFATERGFGAASLSLWDVPFWSERQSEERFGFEEEALKPYFPSPTYLTGSLAFVRDFSTSQ